MKIGPKMPPDLDAAAKKKWAELVDVVDLETDTELLANFCRQHSTLMAIRDERAHQQSAGTFKTMVPGRDGTEVLNPLLVHENRLVAGLNRMLRSLGLAPSREEQDRRKKKRPTGPPPPGFSGEEPVYGWPIAIALCRGPLNPTPEDVELERQREEWLAARKK